jgi:hypothetical protein
VPIGIDKNERYKRVCSQIDFFSQRMADAFRLFIQLTIATVGGFIWLKTQPNADAAADLFPLVRWILPILAALVVIEMASELYSWWGFRQAEAKLLARDDLIPSAKSARLIVFRAAVAILVGTAGFFLLR